MWSNVYYGIAKQHANISECHLSSTIHQQELVNMFVHFNYASLHTPFVLTILNYQNMCHTLCTNISACS